MPSKQKGGSKQKGRDHRDQRKRRESDQDRRGRSSGGTREKESSRRDRPRRQEYDGDRPRRSEHSDRSKHGRRDEPRTSNGHKDAEAYAMQPPAYPSGGAPPPPHHAYLGPYVNDVAQVAQAVSQVSYGGPYSPHQPFPPQNVPHTQVTVGAPLANPPDDRLIFNCVMIFFFWPVAIFAIFKSLKCREAISRGDMKEAASLAATAKKLGYIALGVGIGLIVLGVILGILNNFIWAATYACVGYSCGR